MVLIIGKCVTFYAVGFWTIAGSNNNIFLRKLIIPSCFNAFHPFLNCEVIIFDEKEFVVIDILGNNISKP